jgi:hypothetical protein
MENYRFIHYTIFTQLSVCLSFRKNFAAALRLHHSGWSVTPDRQQETRHGACQMAG